RVVGRSAGAELVEAWIDRAGRRTVKHLREEVAAVLFAVDLHPETSRLPPSEEDLEAVFAVERKIQSGELLRAHYLAREPGPQTSVSLTATSGSRRSLQLTVSPALYAHWRSVAAEFRAVA